MIYPWVINDVQYIKSCSPIKHVRLELYDINGNYISLDGITNCWVSLLSSDKDCNLVVRLFKDLCKK